MMTTVRYKQADTHPRTIGDIIFFDCSVIHPSASPLLSLTIILLSKFGFFCAPSAPRLLSISSIAYNYMLLKPKKPPPGDRSTTEATASILLQFTRCANCNRILLMLLITDQYDFHSNLRLPRKSSIEKNCHNSTDDRSY